MTNKDFVSLCKELRALGATEVVADGFRAAFPPERVTVSGSPATESKPKSKKPPARPPQTEEERLLAEREARFAELTGGL